MSLSIFKVCLLDSNSTQFCLHILLAAESRDSLKSNWMIHLWSVIGGGKWQGERSSIAERPKKEKPDISSKTKTPDLDLRPFICIQFTNLLCYCLQRQKIVRSCPSFTHIDTHCWPLSTWMENGANTPVRWHFEIYFSLCKTSTPPHTPHPACLFHSTVLCDWQLTLQVEEEGLKREFRVTEPSSSPAAGEMACWHGGESGGDGGRGFTLQWKWQCQLNITFNFLVLWSPGY